MGLPITSIVRNRDGSFTYSWVSTGASYYRIVLAGVQIDQVNALSWSNSGVSYQNTYQGYPPPIEVEPETTQALSEQYPSVFQLQWYGIQGVSYYEVQNYVGGAWKNVARITESGDWLYTYQTPVLADETPTQYQVVTIDSLGNRSTPRAFTINTVRPPDSPDPTTQIIYTGAIAHQAQVSPH